MLSEYLFVYSHKDGTFPVRLRIISEAQGVSEQDELTGTVARDEVETVRAELEHKYQKPGYDISRSWANTWQAVQNNYYGLQYHEYPPPQPEIVSAEPENVIFETVASLKTKIIFLLGTVMCAGTFAAIWPEFIARYGSFYVWFFTLIHNTFFAVGGLIIPVTCVAGIVILLRFIYYLRVHVRVDSEGIQIQPGNRRVLWDEVEHLWYAYRVPRYDSIPLGVKRSLRLCIFNAKPIDLPDRFKEMEYLVSVVRNYLDPVLLARAIKLFQDQGSYLFGEQVTITRDVIIFNKERKSLPLDQVSHITIFESTLLVTDIKNRIVFSSPVGLIQDVTIIAGLLQEVKKLY